MGRIEVEPEVLGFAASRVLALADLVRGESSAASRSAACWSVAALDERLPGSRSAEAAALAGVQLGRACDSLAAVLDGLARALRQAAITYAAADTLGRAP